MIPLAAELKEEITLRRAVETSAASSPNPDAVEVQVSVLIEQINFELEVARRERRAVRASVNIPLNVREKYLPALAIVRTFLVARGYSVSINADTLTISWA